jgi:coproporphyrinogen III oxidase-like Fe-S oxidoreductase
MRVGVLTGHDEIVTPADPRFAAFFALLGREGAAVEALAPPYTYERFAPFRCLLVGGPRAMLAPETLDALRTAVAWGHRVLLLGHAGGDARPLGRPAHATNLGALVPGLRFPDFTVYVPSSMEAMSNLEVVLPPGAPGETGVWLVSSGTLELDETDDGAALSVVVRRTLAGAADDARLARRVQPEYDDVLTTAVTTDAAVPAGGATVYAEIATEHGRVFAFASCLALHDDYVRGRDAANRAFVDALLCDWLGLAHTEELARRMRGPQRHRLLQGYPMAPLMLPAAPRDPPPWPSRADPTRARHVAGDPSAGLDPGRTRALLVGVLPHPYCNPQVQGCGFCTFPQEKLDQHRMPSVVAAVTAEVHAWRQNHHPHHRDRAPPHVPALYLGGATANLTPAPAFASLCDALDETFDLADAEITLEGVPRYFQLHDHALMRVLATRWPRARRRISMGVQTLDATTLERMGRAGFGDAATFEAVVRDAHARGFAASCDLLVNLPGQSLAQMFADVDGVAAMGFDQVCLYHLVLFEGLGTPWASERSLLNRLPDGRAACENLRRCRERLLERGFVQRTLTNFERRDATHPPFAYEPLGFCPDQYDLLGFGPAAISLATTPDFRAGLKTLHPTLVDDYLAGRGRRAFHYAARDLAVLFVTRGLARLRVDLARYEALFGRPLEQDFRDELDAVLARGLVRIDAAARVLEPTGEGFYYADAVAGLFAWRRVQQVRALDDVPPGGAAVAGRFEALRFHDPNIADYGGMG